MINVDDVERRNTSVNFLYDDNVKTMHLFMQDIISV
jgi:hypothetical protein